MFKVFRKENKYLISYYDYLRHRAYFNQILTPDSHNGLFGYHVRSLYFDTPFDRDFDEKMCEVECRKKIRLRIYTPQDSFALLELKQKQNLQQQKRSLRMTRDDAIALIKGNYAILLTYDSDFAKEMYALMQTGCYRPKTIIEYTRQAYIAKENSIRLTFDQNIRATENNFNLFDPNLCLYPVFSPSYVVFEVKYNGFMLSYISSVIAKVDQTKVSVSKYCLGRSIGTHYIF